MKNLILIMKKLLAIFLLIVFPLLSFAQQKFSLQFTKSTLSPSQYIYKEFIQVVPNGITDSLCSFILTSVKFTVTSDGSITDFTYSVGLPASLIDPLKKAISNSENHWVNRKKTNVDCILPIMILPANLCPGERPNNTLQSGAQMFKYSGEYINFSYKDFYEYNVDMAEGVILSPILIHDGKMN